MLALKVAAIARPRSLSLRWNILFIPSSLIFLYYIFFLFFSFLYYIILYYIKYKNKRRNIRGGYGIMEKV